MAYSFIHLWSKEMTALESIGTSIEMKKKWPRKIEGKMEKE
jgi:hypothetical protein